MLHTALFWTTYSAYEPVRRIERELILRESAQGASIVGAYCDGALARCHAMRRKRKEYLECAACQSVYRRVVLPLLDRVIHMGRADAKSVAAVPATQSGLRGIRIGSSDIGTSVLSTIKTNRGDDDPPLDMVRDEVEAQLAAGAHVHRFLADVLDCEKPDIVYMFNGRQFDSRPLLRLCQDRRIPFATYEVAVDRDRFVLRENTTVHDIRVAKQGFKLFADTHAGRSGPVDDMRSQIRERRDVYGHGFRSGQETARLPEGFSGERRNVVILHSSEDEYSDVDNSLRLWIGHDFGDFLTILITRFGRTGGVRFYVRLHPRLSRYDARSIQRLLVMRHPLLEVIPPSSPVDTFELAGAADLAICYGSTAGPEAVLMGARVVCVGDCAYAGSGMMPEARDMQSLAQLVADPSMIACREDLAAAYLEFLKASGEPFRSISNDSREPDGPKSAEHWVRRVQIALLKIRFPVVRTRIDYLVYRFARLLSRLERG